MNERRDEWVCYQVLNAGEGARSNRQRCVFTIQVEPSEAARFYAEEYLFPQDEGDIECGDIIDYHVSVDVEGRDVRYIVDVCLRPQFGVHQLSTALDMQQSG